jgi:type VI secretion system protein VasJ
MSNEKLIERARPFVAPIEGTAPAGGPARFDERYEAMVQEVTKLDSPTGGAVDWSAVVGQGTELLKSVSKDLLVASYLAQGMFVLEGLPGLSVGCTVLAELMETYWEGLFPEAKRMRGRINALAWFFERAAIALKTTQFPALQPAHVEAVADSVKRLSDVARAKMGTQAPSARNMVEAIERMRLSLPVGSGVAPAAAAPSGPPSPAAATAAAARAAPVGPPPPAQSLGPSEPVNPVDPSETLRGAGSSLLEASRQMRAANPTDALGYRIGRVGLWLHLAAPPPADAEKRTRVVPLAAGLRSRLELMAANARWLELLEESESAAVQSRFCLELQRTSAQALKALGESYRSAREAVTLEVRALLMRMPALIALRFSDGSPFADAATSAWIEEEVLVSAAPRPRLSLPSVAASSARADEQQGAVDEARKLAGEDKLTEALALLQSGVNRCSSGEGRFRLRLQIARLMQEAGQNGGAQALFEALVAEAAARNLDEWDPPLAVQCLAGALATAAKGANGSDQAARLTRLAKLDPVAALELAR